MNMRKHAVYGILALVSFLGLGLTQSARANFIETITQAGTSVVANGSGAIDLNGLTFAFAGVGPRAMEAINGYIVTGSTDPVFGDVWGGYTGPANFGSGGTFGANAGSGDSVGISVSQNLLLVPTGYVSNTALSSNAVWLNNTFASLGLAPGTYEWTWGDGANQNFTLIIGVPDGGSTVCLLGCALLGVAVLRRKLRC